MLISPPFLPDRPAATLDPAFVESAMPAATTNCPGTSVPEGSFPVSLKMGWHGGTHLHAPTAGQGALPVRCSADGEIVYARAPAAPSEAPGHAQNYNPYGASAAWTDNGMAIVRHTTDIGSGANATAIVFYSLITHLSELNGNFFRVANGTATAAQRQVSRKDLVGVAGRVYGAANHIHMEIVCDDANLGKLAGRRTGPLALTADGRSDAVYGEVYFYLPAGTQFFQVRPADNASTSTAAALHASTAPMIVGMRYAGGDGANPGHAYFNSYLPDGSAIGAAPVAEADAEYELLIRAGVIRGVYESAHAPVTPPLSALYELLRFGRVLGPDALTPVTTPHWRRANYPGGAGFVNLNAEGVFKFSDADFPHWKSWKLIDDDNDADSRCNSAQLISLIEDVSGADGTLTRTELESRMDIPAVRKALSYAICKFPSEWDRDTIDARWGWLKTDADYKLEAADWTLFHAHVSALTVPAAELPEALRAAHWHFHPQRFIEHARSCSWLDAAEMALTLPKYLFYNTANPRTAITTAGATYTLTRATATTRLAGHQVPLNQCIRKYIGPGRQRIAIFLAQVILETAQWRSAGNMCRLMHEWYYGQVNPQIPQTQFYKVFYGRGIMQLTWLSNYKAYGEYRALPNHTGAYVDRLTPASPRITATSLHYSASGGAQVTWSPRYDPDFIGEDPYSACDSGGHFWIGKPFSGMTNINRVCDRAFTPASVGLVNRLVNGGSNGYHDRQAYAAYLMRLLTEDTSTDATRTVVLPAPNGSVTVNFSRT